MPCLCGKSDYKIFKSDTIIGRLYVKCLNCGLAGPRGLSEYSANKLWRKKLNARTQTQAHREIQPQRKETEEEG